MSLPAPSPFAVFRNRSFSLMWVGQLVSTFGDSLTQLAAGILVFRLTGSALIVGLMFAVTSLPSLLFGLVAGVYVDRWNRKKILVISCFLQALLVALIPVMLPFSVAWLYVLVALSSTVRQFFTPAHDSVLPEVADDAALEAANSMMNISATASSVLGFAAAGLLASQISLNWVFLLDALTFVIAGSFLLGITVPHHDPGDADEVRTILGDIQSGMTHLFGTPVLRAILLLGLSFGIALSTFNTLNLPFVLSQLRGGSEVVFGIQEGVMSVGFVLGSLLMASFASRLTPRLWMVVSLLGMGSLTFVYAFGNSIPLAAIIVGLTGFFNAPILIAIKTIFQRKTPAALRGRVLGAYYVGVETVWLVGALVGGLGDLLGIRMLIAVVGVVTLAAGVMAAVLPGLKTTPIEEPQVGAVGLEVESTP